MLFIIGGWYYFGETKETATTFQKKITIITISRINRKK